MYSILVAFVYECLLYLNFTMDMMSRKTVNTLLKQKMFKTFTDIQNKHSTLQAPSQTPTLPLIPKFFPPLAATNHICVTCTYSALHLPVHNLLRQGLRLKVPKPWWLLDITKTRYTICHIIFFQLKFTMCHIWNVPQNLMVISFGNYLQCGRTYSPETKSPTPCYIICYQSKLQWLAIPEETLSSPCMHGKIRPETQEH